MVKTINTTLLAARNPKRKYAFSIKLDENGNAVQPLEKVFDVFEDDGVTKVTLIDVECKWSHRAEAAPDTWEPFMCTPWDDYEHSQKLWTDLNNGVHGAIDESDLEGW